MTEINECSFIATPENTFKINSITYSDMSIILVGRKALLGSLQEERVVYETVCVCAHVRRESLNHIDTHTPTHTPLICDLILSSLPVITFR